MGGQKAATAQAKAGVTAAQTPAAPAGRANGDGAAHSGVGGQDVVMPTTVSGPRTK